jgi:CubicO group peptidase (beta-lactamase class C family)
MARMTLGSGIVACGLLACIGAASVAAGHGGAPSARTRAIQRLDRVVGAIQALRPPGAVIAVTGGPAGSYDRTFGLAGPGRAMSPRDHFRIGSITKTFTATVILELVDRHKLSLTDRLSRWEPRVPDADRITIAMLLGMRSGIWDEGGSGPDGQPSLLSQWAAEHCTGTDPLCSRKVWTPQQIVDLAIRQGRAFAPGTWYYSDTNYVILGIIAADVTHQPFARLVRRMVLRPLGLGQTSFPVASTALPRPATAGYIQGAGDRYRRAPVLNPSATFAAGNMISTVGDLQKWARAFATGRLLSARTRRLQRQFAPTPDASPPLAGTGVATTMVVRYGLGMIDLSNLRGHNGFLPVDGYSAEMWALPGGRRTVVTLFNSIAACEGDFLADAADSALAQAAFGTALYRAAAAAGVECPKAPAG